MCLDTNGISVKRHPGSGYAANNNGPIPFYDNCSC